MLEMVVLEDHIEEEVVLEVLAPPCVYTFICVEIKTNTETVATPVFQKVETTLVREAFFFLLDGEGVWRGAAGPIFFMHSSSLSLFLTTNPMSL